MSPGPVVVDPAGTRTAGTGLGDRNRADLTPAEARALLRAGLVAHTAGWCAGFVQANLIAVPRAHAFDLLLFAQRNPKPCPVLGVLEPGEFSGDLFSGDIRTDIGAYRVFDDDGARQVTDVTDCWRDDLVAFIIGCSFTFEEALREASVPVAHIEQGVNVPMYRTARACAPAGVMRGPLVVSMRPVPPQLVAEAVRVTARYPSVHGAPVHVGDPQALGIEDLGRPDYGDAVEIPTGWVPMFWACGVTPQEAVQASGIPFAISHAPGHMLITDARNAAYLAP